MNNGVFYIKLINIILNLLGTSIKNENVYIIDFSPRKKGLYEGRLYISVETYALIRADYNYASNKIGLDAQAFGLSYSKTNFSGSICFERKNNIYILNYLSFQENNKFKVNRKVAFQKEKEKNNYKQETKRNRN